VRDYEIRYDPRKAEENLRKHGLSFDEAAEAMRDFFAAVCRDRKSHSEDRYLLVGQSKARHTLLVCYAIEDDIARLINARNATPAEKRRYMNERDMIRDTPMEPEDEMLPEYGHLEGWRRNPLKFVRLAASVTIEPDVYNVFRTSEQVNAALRDLIAEGRYPH
jgi:uncharacterized DUF497 family protein